MDQIKVLQGKEIKSAKIGRIRFCSSRAKMCNLQGFLLTLFNRRNCYKMNQMFTLPERSQGVKVERDAVNFSHGKWKSNQGIHARPTSSCPGSLCR